LPYSAELRELYLDISLERRPIFSLDFGPHPRFCSGLENKVDWIMYMENQTLK